MAEGEPESFDMIVYKEVLKKGHYIAAHLLPHDSRHKHISAKYSTLEKFKMVAASAKVFVVDMVPIQIGIQATQSMLTEAKFNRTKCQQGLAALHIYGDKSPKWASHSPDALRYAALGARFLTGNTKAMLTNKKPEFVPTSLGFTYDF